jgi:hypothetical protein
MSRTTRSCISPVLCKRSISSRPALIASITALKCSIFCGLLVERARRRRRLRTNHRGVPERQTSGSASLADTSFPSLPNS